MLHSMASSNTSSGKMEGIKRASKTLKNVTNAWIADQEVEIEKGKVVSYRVRMRITFVLED